jgi:hypothetical protein
LTHDEVRSGLVQPQLTIESQIIPIGVPKIRLEHMVTLDAMLLQDGLRLLDIILQVRARLGRTGPTPSSPKYSARAGYLSVIREDLGYHSSRIIVDVDLTCMLSWRQ